ncbi:MAG: WhiB family transcriptional regulator [Actinomycetota bacterium]
MLRPQPDWLDRVDSGEARLAAVAKVVVGRRPAWTKAARCRGTSVDFTDLRYKARALSICDRCPVRDQCLEWAYALDDRVAVLGGTTPEQRLAMRPDTGEGASEPRRGGPGQKSPASFAFLSTGISQGS